MQILSLLRLNLVVTHGILLISVAAPILYRHILCAVYCYDMRITIKDISLQVPQTTKRKVFAYPNKADELSLGLRYVKINKWAPLRNSGGVP